MKDVTNARGEFFRFGHGVVTAPETHYYYNGGLAPRVLVQGGGAINLEVVVAVRGRAAFFTRRMETECIEQEEIPKFCRSETILSVMKNIQIPQLPRHVKIAALAECLGKVLQNQEVFIHTFWEAFQSLGYRLDKHDIAFEAVRDRLWKIEHPLAGELLEKALGLKMEDGA